MITAEALTKRYGARTAVDDLSFTVRPGTVTGFLGPNGAGKSTTTRMILGLDTPTRGRATVGTRAYAAHPAPLTEVGALLEARSLHPGRTAYHHLRPLAHSHGIPPTRVTHVLKVTGLTDVAHHRVKDYSLGMGQRLGIATALLLDEPVNGLDPEGVLWIRNLLKSLAAEGRTVLISSHLMIRSTVTAVPRRLPVLWSKATVLAAVTFATALTTNLITFLVTKPFLADTDQATSLGDPGVLRALTGNALGLALLGVMALAIGSLIRSVPGAIGVLIGAVMILPEVPQTVPYDPVDEAVRHFPAKALGSLTHAHPMADMTTPGIALLTLTLWTAAALAAAALHLRRRDV